MKVPFLLQTATPDMLDSIIGALIVLLILSLINEKFVDLIRKYVKVPKAINRGQWMKSIGKGYTDDPEENEEKTKQISLLAIIVGLVIALLAKASLFDLLFKAEIHKSLFWSDGSDIDNLFTFILGIIFTGFFLSFGSKFFHDLLDVLYQTKEYKRKLQNKQLYDRTNYDDLVAFINTDSHKLAEQALRVHGPKIKQKYGGIVSGIELGNTIHNQIGLIVTLKTSPPPNFPKAVPVKLPNGAKVMIAVEAHEKRTGYAQFGLTYRLTNEEYFNYRGALGGVLVSRFGDDKKYLLTCSHVVLGGKSDDLGGEVSQHHTIHVLDGEDTKTTAELVYAKLDKNNDTALVALNEWESFGCDNELPDGSFFNEAIPVEVLQNDAKVKFYSSRMGDVIEGVIHKLESKEDISLQYDDAIVKDFSGVIVVGNNEGERWKSISKKGDSGAILYDVNNFPFGMIIGGCEKFTYALPLSQVLESTNTQIFNQQQFIV